MNLEHILVFITFFFIALFNIERYIQLRRQIKDSYVEDKKYLPRANSWFFFALLFPVVIPSMVYVLVGDSYMTLLGTSVLVAETVMLVIRFALSEEVTWKDMHYSS